MRLLVTSDMMSSYEEKIIIKYFRVKYKHGATRIANDHADYEWNVNCVKKLLKNIERLVTLLENNVRTLN